MAILAKMTEVWILKKDSMGGGGFHHTVYVDRNLAREVANDMRGEFISFLPVAESGEVITGNRIIINRTVYDFNNQSSIEYLKSRALSKLDDGERMALGYSTPLVHNEDKTENKDLK